jgi:hypothetical protein
MTLNRNRKKWLVLKILHEYAQGISYQRIADKYQVSTKIVFNILHGLNKQSMDDMKNYVVNRIPLQFESSLVLLRSIMEFCYEIATKSEDPRVRLGALSLQRECNQDINHLLADSVRVSEAVNRIMESNTRVMEQHTELMGEARMLRNEMKQNNIIRDKRKEQTDSK